VSPSLWLAGSSGGFVTAPAMGAAQFFAFLVSSSKPVSKLVPESSDGWQLGASPVRSDLAGGSPQVLAMGGPPLVLPSLETMAQVSVSLEAWQFGPCSVVQLVKCYNRKTKAPFGLRNGSRNGITIFIK
jgi:hypothetical protein